MYMSKVEIDFTKTKSKKDLNHVGAYHNWVEQSFKEKKPRKLWRIDNLNNKSYLLVVSEEKPNKTKLEEYGVAGTAEIKNYSNYLETLKKGMKLKFKATLNPVISIKNKENPNKRGRVVPHITTYYQEKYLIDRSEKNGFKLNEFLITERNRVLFKHKDLKGNKPIKLSKVTYEGILEIIDIKKFKNILINGLGKKKAYGFGLMTVIPI